jgi:hypothetical protein
MPFSAFSSRACNCGPNLTAFHEILSKENLPLRI